MNPVYIESVRKKSLCGICPSVWHHSLCSVLCHCSARNYHEFSTCISNTVLSAIHKLAGFESAEHAVPINNIKSVCFYCNIEDRATSYVIERVNQMEWE